MTMKYDKMIEITQAESQRKMENARNAIADMLSNMERVTVAGLVRKTGLSRGFFYKNPTIREELDNAIRTQGACYNPRQVIIDKAMNNTLIILKSEIRKVKSQNEELVLKNEELSERNEQLCKEIETLKKQLKRKEVSLLKRL